MKISERPWSSSVLVFIPADALKSTVSPLVERERRWVESLARLMRRMPPRLSLLEHGGSLSVIDKEASKQSELADGAARKDGVILAEIMAASQKVQSCSA